MITIDGSMGEGGGQILRTSLALALVTGRPFRIEKIRAGRKRPGLMRQHLTAVQAAATLGGAAVTGDSIGSQELVFEPGPVQPGRYHFAVGTAGSATLVLQTVLPALLLAKGPSQLTLEGGTHNPWAPPFDFLDKTLLPLIGRMGPSVAASLQRHGFYPAGGGHMEISVQPVRQLQRLELAERGAIQSRRARALFARLPAEIGKRELAVVKHRLGWPDDQLVVEEVRTSAGPGNVLLIELQAEHVTEVFTGFGAIGRPAEAVAAEAVDEAKDYLAAGVPVGIHLADQLLVPLALAGGRFRTLSPTRHTRTNVEVIRRFLDVRIAMEKIDQAAWQIEAGV